MRVCLIADPTIRQLNRIDKKAEDLSEVKNKLEDSVDWLSLLGLKMIAVKTMEDRDGVVDLVAQQFVQGSMQVALEQFKYGLNSLGLLDASGNHPDSFRALFVDSIKPPTARDLRDLFKVTYFIPCGNRRCLENDTICHWFNWLAELQDGECPPLTVMMVLEFATGATVVPPLGFEDTPTIEFLHTARGGLAGQQKKKYPEIQVPVRYEGKEWTLPLVIVKGEKSALLGRNWLQKIKLNWGEIFSLSKDKPVSQATLTNMLEKHKELFKDGYGEIQDFTAKVRVQEGTEPIFHKPRPVPYALKEAVEKELDRLQKNNIITKVARSDWAAPIVVVPKKDKTVRMCGDYKVTTTLCASWTTSSCQHQPLESTWLLNYYGKFVANLSTLLHPLHQLLQADTKWNWSPQCEEAFKTCKQRLLKSKWLAHYNTEMKLRLACDASPYGVGAVISHVLSSGEEHPIAFASRTLSPSEKNYAQIEKEALSIIFGVKKFHKYLYGRKFQLLTDHKPLLAILGPKSAIPTLAALRMQRWALILLAYDYEIEYRRSSDHANADALSRLPCNSDSDSEDDRAVFQISLIDELPISASDIAEETRKDPVLSKVLDLTLGGWPNFVNDDNLRPFIDKKDQLSTDQGCVLWGSRVVVPHKFQRRLLSDLHEGHPGITRMKALARSYLWCPGLDQDIQQHVGHCSPCEAVRNKPAAAPLHPWSWAATPWERIHVDYAEIDKQHFLVVVDVHSKWMEVFPTQLTTAEKTINLLRHLFASFGLVKELVSDNGPPFTSKDFEMFLKNNGVRHILSPPYHPASNGAAERAVQTFMKAWTRLEVQSTFMWIICYGPTPQQRHAERTITTPRTILLTVDVRERQSLTFHPNLAHHRKPRRSGDILFDIEGYLKSLTCELNCLR
ncbi:uncharacterized protein K02A2.6 [Salvelinus alpinus]|uniref:uncharacterized protein K02A2.6 n=1 Tax=Salvelinus alpinus TaxID=8036 RepID=UPI0039FCDDF6